MPRFGWSRLSWSVLIVPALLLSVLEVSAQNSPAEYKPGELIIKFRQGVSVERRQAIMADLGAQPMRHFPRLGADRLKITQRTVPQAVARYKTDPDVIYIEPNYILRPDIVPNDPQFPSLWGMRNTGQTGGTAGADIHATQAWDVTTGSTSVLVAIIDTGTDYTHPDLSANIFANPGEIPGNSIDDDSNGFIDDVRGWDFANRDNDPMDDDGHGTHVAGTVGAVGNNGIGVVGVNWQVKLLPIKFLGFGGGTTEDAILSIDYAVLMGADVINASWGGAGYSEALRQSILNAEAAGTIFAAAAGNSGVNTDFSPHYPSSYDVPSLVSVAATDHSDVLAGFSNYGVVSVDLAGPGVNILSTFPANSYGTISGTSMATPHVAGALALIYGRNPGIGPLAAKNLMLNRVDPVPSLSGRVLTGGRLNAFMPVADADSIPPGAISSLAVTLVQGSRIELGWTSTGDDGAVGRASRYDARVSNAPITSGNFYAATPVPGLPNPLPAGTPQSVSVGGLAFSTTYHAAIRAFDEFDNEGPISNVVVATTLGPPDVAVSPASLSADLLTGQTTTHQLTLTNSGVSELSFVVEIDGPPGATPQVDVIGRGAASGAVLARGTSVGVKHLDPGEQPFPSTVRVDGPIDRTGAGSNAVPGPGRQVLSTSEEVFGSPQTGFIAGPRTRGNIFACTVPRTLREHRLFLEPSSSTQLWFLVYEGMSQSGTYQLVSASNTTPAGPGAGWYSSGPVEVDMVAGRYYMIVAAFETPSTYYNQQAISPYPVPASFGSLIAGLGWDWAPSTVFPPQPSEEVPSFAFGSPVAYYQTLITGDAVTWLAVEPDTGLVGASSSLALQVTFDATGLNGGDYDAIVRITSNDPDESAIEIPASLHVTGAPDIAVAPSAIDFGSVFIGGERIVPLRVSNPGTDLLTITGVAISPSVFSGPSGAFPLAPGEFRDLAISYHPSAAGSDVGSVTIHSNDPDEPIVVVDLAGTGLIPPDIDVSPTSVSADLLTGESATRTVTIRNTGGSDLTFTAEATHGLAPQALVPPPPAKGQPDSRHGPPVADSRGGPDAFGYQWKDSDEPGGPVFDWVEISGIGTPIPLAGDDWNSGTIPIGFNFSYYGQSFSSLQVCSNGWLSFTSFSAQYASYPLPSPGAPENLLAAFWSDLATNPSTVFTHYDGTRMIVEWRNVTYLGGGPPFSFQILLYPNGKIVYQYLDMGGTQTVASVGFQNATRDDGLSIAFNTPYVRNGLAIEIAAGPPWLSVSPEAGTIPAGGQLDLEVRFDASGLFGGDYDGVVAIASNDPDESPVAVAAHLHVTGAPDIQVTPISIDFGPVYVLAAPTESLLVRNVGTDLLDVTSVTSSRSEYTFSPPGAFSLAPGASRALSVTFRPTAAGPTPGTLRLFSNDSDENPVSVALAGTGVLPPDIAVAPESLSVNLLSGQTAQRTLTISNTGPTPLDWALSIQGGPGIAPLSTTPTEWQVLSVVDPGRPRNGPPPSGVVQAVRARFGQLGPGAPSILFYSDDFLRSAGSQWGDLALQALGLSYTAIYFDPPAFAAALSSQTWDLVVVNNDGYYEMPWALVEAHLNAGGRAVIGTFEIDASHSTPTTLWNTIGLTLNADLLIPAPVHWWTPGHSLFNSPESVPPMSSFTDYYSDDGDRVTALPGTDTPAGFTPSATPGQSAIVVSATRSAIVNSFLLSENTSDLDFDGRPDAVELLENEITYMMSSWLTADPTSGTVSPGSSANVTLTFDATDLDGGDYVSSLVVISNDPDESPVVVPAHLHVTGVPDISVDPLSFDFGSLFIGLTHTVHVTVSNPGHDLLLFEPVVSGADYSVSPSGSFGLAPRQSMVVDVTFAPSAAGPRPGTLTLNSNDPDEPAVVVPLSGTGLIPPDIGVSPTSLSANLAPGRQTTRTVTLRNTGGSDLTFTVGEPDSVSPYAYQAATHGKGQPDPRHGNPVAENAGGPDAFGYSWKDSDEPGGPVFNWVEISGIGTPIPFSGDDWNYGPIPIGFNFPYYGQSFSSLQVCSNGWLSFTSFSAQYSSYPLPSSFAPENMLAAFWADLLTGPSTVFTHYDGTRMIVEWRNVTYLGGGPPFSFQILLYPNGKMVYQYLDMGGATFASVGFQNGTRDDGLTIAFQTPYVRDGLAIEISSVPQWLSASPESGTIPAGGQLDLQVLIDATELEVGDYEDQLRIASNDPDEPMSFVTASLHVVNAPVLEVIPSALAFGETFIGYPRSLDLTLRSVGQMPVQVTGMTAGLPEYTAQRAVPFTLAPGETTRVSVRLAPTTAGTKNTTMTIASNSLDAPQHVDLTGSALHPPVVSVTPALLTINAAPGGQGTGALHVCNNGLGVLHYSVRVADIPTGASVAALLEQSRADGLHEVTPEAPSRSARSGATRARGGVGMEAVEGVVLLAAVPDNGSDTVPAASVEDPITPPASRGEAVMPVSISIHDPAGGVMAPGTCGDIEVSWDAALLSAGDYFALLHVDSNDPARPVVTSIAQLHVSNPVPVEFDLKPKKLKLKEKYMHKRIEASIKTSAPYTPYQINISSIRLNGLIGIDPSRAPRFENHHGETELVVWFRRADVAQTLPVGEAVPVTVTGEIGTEIFSGTDHIEVRGWRIHHPHLAEVLHPAQLYTVEYEMFGTATAVQFVKLLSSFDGGENWNVERTNLPNTGRISWTVPSVTADSALLAVVEVEAESPPDEVSGVLKVSDVFSIRSQLAVPGAPGTTELLPVSPNPSAGLTHLRFVLGREEEAALQIFDLQGRQVRALTLGLLGPGPHQAQWDGRNDHGVPAGAGLYFVRLVTRSGEWTQRVVRMN